MCYWQSSRLILLLLLTLPWLSGCETISFYHQAASGQLRILAARKPIDKLIAAPDTAPPLRRQLQLVQSIRAYASAELQLPVGGAYAAFTQLKEAYPLWNLIVAAEFSLTPERWCFPIAGCASYRGYFTQSAAHAKAAEMCLKGFDVYLGPVPAYSTLGWFDDPVLSSFVNWSPERLAGLLFHELAHRQLYIAGDTRFNESFATAVTQIALPQWRRRQGLPALSITRVQRTRKINGLMLAARKQLQKVYKADLTVDKKRKQKAHILRQLRGCYRQLSTGWPEDKPFRNFIEKINNATLALLAEYQSQVPAFTQLYRDSGSSWPVFYPAAALLGTLPRQQRDQRLKALSLRAEDSRRKVTGPSLHNETCMSAANTPLTTRGN